MTWAICSFDARGRMTMIMGSDFNVSRKGATCANVPAQVLL
jgi:hypothetical protein